jgi:hypothetical protein
MTRRVEDKTVVNLMTTRERGVLGVVVEKAKMMEERDVSNVVRQDTNPMSVEKRRRNVLSVEAWDTKLTSARKRR